MAKSKQPPEVVKVNVTSTPVNQVEKYDMVTISRKNVRGAPYNPRIISDEAKRRLTKNLQEVGLLEPLVWNKQTGNLVSGHKRLNIMDTIIGRDDYDIRVAQVDLSPKREKEQNIAFNNQEMQGMFDMGGLQTILLDKGIDYTMAGFSAVDMTNMFGVTSAVSSQSAEKMKEVAEGIHKAQEVLDNIVESASFNEDDPDFQAQIIFKSPQERFDFFNACGIDSQPYVDGETLKRLLLDRAPDALTEVKEKAAANHTIIWLARKLIELPPTARLDALEEELKNIRELVKAEVTVKATAAPPPAAAEPEPAEEESLPVDDNFPISPKKGRKRKA